MNFKYSILLKAFVCLLISTNAIASGHVHNYNDPLQKTFIKNPQQILDYEYQQALMLQPSWQKFVDDNKSWKVIFNENSAMPHRAYGKPVAVPGFDIRSTAENFILNQLLSFRVPFNNLVFRSVSTNNKYHYINYLQYHQGLEVLYSNVQVRMTHDYRVNQFALDCYPNILLSVVPGINASAASHYASLGVPGIQNIIVTPNLKVLPVPGNRNYNFHLVYEVMVENMDSEGIPGKYYTLVDASGGQILYRANQVYHVANTDINVTGTIHLTHPYHPSTVEPMKNLRITENGNIHFTDDAGLLSLNNVTNTLATFSLQGRWVKVQTNNVTPSWVVNLTSGTNSINIDSNNTNIRQRTTYNAINTIHEYMKSKYPTFTALDYPLPANIDVAGNCNAFYNGSSVNFYDAGNGCNATSLIVDVCYHEYGHGINHKFYDAMGMSFDNGAMHEGYADLWALGITTLPVLGIGFFDNNPLGFIRRYDINKKVYPQNLVGQVHADGEIIAGAFWDVGINLGNLEQMMDLFKETYFAGITGPNGTEGMLFTDILLETLAQDDDDGDLTNGTPNYCAILAGFESHGIVLNPVPVVCAPIALFTFSPFLVCEGSNVTFKDQSNFPDSWSWDFPGGTPSASVDKNPVITYNAAGIYDVTLTVTNAAGSDSYSQTGIITVQPGTGQYSVPFTESFETAPFPGTDWAIENESGNTWEQTTLAAKTGTNSIFIDNYNGNTQGTTDVFVTPAYNLTGSTNNSMTFELAFAISDTLATDKLRVLASTTCGQLWNVRYVKSGTAIATAGLVTTPFIPDPTHWSTQTVNISTVSYSNKPNVMFKFEYTHDKGNNIFIDDINIAGTLVGLNDLISESLNFNVYPNPVSTSATVGFTLEHAGNVVIDVVDVLGRIVNNIAETKLEAGEYHFELPLQLTNGVYIVRVNIDGVIMSKKVVVNR